VLTLLLLSLLLLLLLTPVRLISGSRSPSRDGSSQLLISV
jgi:hypothetical protein